jgi:hypothetical protein
MNVLLTFTTFLLLSSCTATELKAPSEFSHVYVEGPYAKQWTSEDFRQIRQLIQEHPKIRKPLYGVDAFAPNRAHILSGSEWLDVNSIGAIFDVEKRNGRWFIVKDFHLGSSKRR